MVTQLMSLCRCNGCIDRVEMTVIILTRQTMQKTATYEFPVHLKGQVLVNHQHLGTELRKIDVLSPTLESK